MGKKQQFWQSHIEAWRKSGLSQSAYCNQQKLSLSSFGYWLHRRGESVAVAKILPIVVSGQRSDARVEVRLPNGWSVKLPLGVRSDDMVSLLHFRHWRHAESKWLVAHHDADGLTQWHGSSTGLCAPDTRP
ncbi:hypothetical protein EO087_01400 [Dyella sp. M7H15-1]|uniref:IS66 family insertion sequence element accessory protein TnpA n=1 Tax=Dyella sp. M7H15-1 TaxID=2501295 RepID=UPI001004E798|nr:hypothetical protein [Dyella sp. M7H15-1]QAU22803.1 hypothetical protein EO087_01400 [Dyella sp. M7H15-1]